MARAAADRRPLATIEEVSEYLQISVQTLYDWRKRHVGPPSAKVGRHLRYRWSDVDRWLDTRQGAA